MKLFSTLLLCLIFSHSAFASSEEEVTKADNLLNKNYQQLSGILNGQSKTDLKKAQLAWIKFRDKSCAFEAQNLTNDKNWMKNSIGEIDRLACITRLSSFRTKELEVYLNLIRGVGSKDLLNNIITQAENRKAAVHVIGVYKGDYPDEVRRSSGDRPDGRIDVTVTNNPKVKSYILILASYEPVNWHILAKDGVKIDKIILSSYHASKISGADDTPVVRKNLGITYKGLSLGLKEKIKESTGFDTEFFQGSYSGKFFEIH